MKKKAEKKLSLGKIKIASLSEKNQQSIQGGRINQTQTICGVCHTPNTRGCNTNYVYCDQTY